jgi:predicted nucleic acid-binding protein
MTEVVVDNCALLHAVQMGALQYPPLPLVAALLESGALRMVTTKAVRGELSQSIEHVVAAWEGRGWLRTQNVSLQQLRALGNLSRRPKPGRNDLALIALAVALEAPLLTHDAPAQHYALDKGVGVQVIDLLDLVLWACHRGLAPLEALSAAWGAEPHPEWPKGWAGSATAEWAQRQSARSALWAAGGGAAADHGPLGASRDSEG